MYQDGILTLRFHLIGHLGITDPGQHARGKGLTRRAHVQVEALRTATIRLPRPIGWKPTVDPGSVRGPAPPRDGENAPCSVGSAHDLRARRRSTLAGQAPGHPELEDSSLESGHMRAVAAAGFRTAEAAPAPGPASGVRGSLAVNPGDTGTEGAARTDRWSR
ncbi:hypothetical protein ACWD5R_43825 [Streptomyces sp. NPDC002514]|uniref:hypothetical protein n=1 Tax=Streptomyces sp. NPDC001270 TaxID=3364554 RepID=UPI0036C1795E